MSRQVRPSHSGRLCAAEINVLLRPWAALLSTALENWTVTALEK
jgi:hypothetical protein